MVKYLEKHFTRLFLVIKKTPKKSWEHPGALGGELFGGEVLKTFIFGLYKSFLVSF